MKLDFAPPIATVRCLWSPLPLSIRAISPRMPVQFSDIVEEEPTHDLEEADYRRWLVRRTLELIRADFSKATWDAFNRFVLEGQPAATVAASLGISANAVYLARNRVLTRLRQELAGLLE